MELILQQGLPHQQKAIDAVCGALDGVTIIPPVQFYENPKIDLSDRKLADNIRDLQNAVPAEYRSSAPIGTCLNLDIKMETGTGKTYVYTKTIFELHMIHRWRRIISRQILKKSLCTAKSHVAASQYRQSQVACIAPTLCMW